MASTEHDHRNDVMPSDVPLGREISDQVPSPNPIEFSPEAHIEERALQKITHSAPEEFPSGYAPQDHTIPDIIEPSPAVASLTTASITGPLTSPARKWLTFEGKAGIWQYEPTGTARPKFVDKKAVSRLNDTNEETLLKAIRVGDEEFVATLLDQQVGSEHQDERGRTALLYAAERGSDMIVRMLLEYGANWNVADDSKRTALHLASFNGRDKVVEVLLQHSRIGIEKKDDQGNTALHLAARSGNEIAIQHLLYRRASVQVKTNLGNTPLHLAAKKSLVAVETLLRIVETEVDERNHVERTPLMQACDRPSDRPPSEESENIVKLLLNQRNSADPLARDINGETPLSLAASSGNTAVVKVLVDNGADINTLNIDGNSALFGPAKFGHDETARILLDCGIDSRIINNDLPPGRTALLESARYDKFKVALLILDKWAQNTLESQDLIQSALFEAALYDSSQVARLLIERGANISARGTRSNKTAVEVAKLRGSQRVVALLLENGGQLFSQGPSLGAHVQQISSEAGISLLPPVDSGVDLGFGFKSTIVSFSFDDHENFAMARPPVQSVLYDHNPEAITTGLEAATNMDSTSKSFRWLHIPGNNPSWVNNLISRMYKECKAPEEAAYYQKKCKHLFGEEMWSRHQYQMSSTSVAHRRFIRPICQQVPMSKTDNSNMMMVLPYFHWETTEGREKMTDVIMEAMKDCIGDISPFATTQLKGLTQALKELERARDPDYQDEQSSDSESGYMSSSYLSDSAVSMKSSDRRSKRSRRSRESEAPALEIRHDWIDPSEGAKARTPEVVFIRPEEERRKRRRIEKVIDIARTNRSADDKLILSYMFHETAPMHFRRTLDREFLMTTHQQSFATIRYIILGSLELRLTCRRDVEYYYYTLPTTEARDKDQVITRYFEKTWPGDDKLVLMVDQLWLWILDNDTVVTSFPQRWNKAGKPGERDPDPSNASDIVEGILRHVAKTDRRPLESAFDLAELIASKCVGTMFEHPDVANEKLRFSEFFEISIGNVTNEESKMFDEFTDLSERLATGDNHTADLDMLFNISRETKLIKEIKDIRDELYIISTVLYDQERVLVDMDTTVRAIKHGKIDEAAESKENYSGSHQKARKYHSLVESVRRHIETVKGLDKQAEKTYLSLNDLLDLKQKQANVSEARSQRQQAQETARQGQTLMLFTVITVFFLPLSFLTTFFQLDIADYVRNGQGQLSLAYVSEITFPITALVVTVSLFLAFRINPAKIAKKALTSTWHILIKATGILLFLLVLPLIFILAFAFSSKGGRRNSRMHTGEEEETYSRYGRSSVSHYPRKSRNRRSTRMSRMAVAMASVAGLIAIFGLRRKAGTRDRRDPMEVIEEGRCGRSYSRGEKHDAEERSRSRLRHSFPPARRGSVIIVEELSTASRRAARRGSHSHAAPPKNGLINTFGAMFGILRKGTERTETVEQWYGFHPAPKTQVMWPPWAWFRKKPDPTRRATREIYVHRPKRKSGLGQRLAGLLALAALCCGLSRRNPPRRDMSPNSTSYQTWSTRISNSGTGIEPRVPIKIGVWKRVVAWLTAIWGRLLGIFKGKPEQTGAGSRSSDESGSTRSVRRRRDSIAGSDRESRRSRRSDRITVERRSSLRR
ncbi:uncharacterized protein RCO7_01996 [Rhynchosporium graminicola]|uniref:Uncharacterized protein n=1 Tax=Rhynchosporium graminicola TaxID=2792576 RepID=A0A1E1KT90_9HELO|nr:uncharacterized protein RCO7_01996 [Rhynchosporium commune]